MFAPTLNAESYKADSKGQNGVPFIFIGKHVLTEASGLITSLGLNIATEIISNLVNTLWELL